MDTGFSIAVIAQIIFAVSLWPFAHIPTGAPFILAWQKEREVNPWILGACLAAGQLILSVTTYLSYLSGLRFPLVGFLTVALPGSMWVWGLILLLRSRWRLSLPKWLLVGLLVTMAFILLRLIKGVVHDEGFHFPKVASILLGDHPLFVPNGTRGYFRAYHFGVDYLAAFWTWAVFPFRQWIPFNAIAFWGSAATYVLLYYLIRKFLSDPWAAIAPLLAFWLGNWYSPVGLWDIIFKERSLITILMNAYNPTFFSYFIQAPMVFGFPVILSALCLAEDGRFFRSGLLAGPLLLANQALFVFWVGYSTLAVLTNKRCILALLISLVLSPPFLPHLAVHGSLSDPPSFVFGLAIVNLMETGRLPPLLNYFLFFFPMLPLYIHGTVIALRGGNRLILLPLLTMTFLSLVMPHFVAYMHTGDFFKFLMLWGVFGLPITLLSVSHLWRKSWLWRIALIGALAPGIISYILGFGVTSARTRRLVKWERVRPDIITAQKTLTGNGGVLIVSPPIKYTPISGGVVDYADYNPHEHERLLMVLGGAGVPHYPTGQIYGKARNDYRMLIGPWTSLEDIPDSLLTHFNVGFIALPSEMPMPAMADERAFATGNTTIYRIRNPSW